MAAWCEECDLDSAFCIHGNPPTKTEKIPATGPTITALMSSTCPGCGDRIHESIDRITLTDEGWIHAREATDDEHPTTDPAIFDGIE